MSADLPLIEDIRTASRSIARHWGFMGGNFAGSDLSPSAVHALIEIEKGGVTGRDLAVRLRLEKSSVSRMLRKLVDAGHVSESTESSAPADSRVKPLALTATGHLQLEAIHAFARDQVRAALGRLPSGHEHAVLSGLRLYGNALAGATESQVAALPVNIETGYQPGLIACITLMHARYYAGDYGFGQRFESVVAAGLADFCNRLQSPKNGVWTAVRGGKIFGSVAIDGEDLGGNVAHLRWFIVGDAVRGSGVGGRLLDAALAFVDRQGFRETHLWTFDGLAAARHLYESRGFVCVEQRPGAQWGKEVLEQRFVRQLKKAGQVNTHPARVNT